MKKLPIGLNSLEKIIKGNYVYVDKTDKILELIEGGSYYFLSRPRRFGKTLTVDTLKNIFEGNKEIFEGLYIHDKWNWDKRYPVIRIDFSTGEIDNTQKLYKVIFSLLEEHAKRYGLAISKDEPGLALREMVLNLYETQRERVVILIDEYDKPILDNITKPEVAEKIRDSLADFYGVLKGLDEYLKFVFLTGVTKFSKVNLFSKLNNLEDITLDPRYSTLCGYTDEELERYFSEYLKNVDREQVKLWYNGYSWLGEKVYNPFDILLFISKGFQFRPYWFETGTPTFLMKLLKKEKYYIPNLDTVEASDELLSSFDVYTMEIESLLWQTGYLTITGTKMLGIKQIYKLSYPNLEVKISLNERILRFLSGINQPSYTRTLNIVYQGLVEGNVDKIISGLKTLFSSISYTNFTKNEIASYEGYYASVIYTYFHSLGVQPIAEDVTSRGRIDLTIKIEDKVYIFEFKVIEEEKDNKNPLEQIKEKKYFEKHKNEANEIYLIGISFSKEERNITSYSWEKI
ncbi:ATP-binding protein [Thermotomaculum hydrothermale]|nr:ATP-binding protein [Thermotomaculum hydrothermale]